ncbi:MAG: GGDEF domain-containing protein [Lysobacteraceae bacterium]
MIRDPDGIDRTARQSHPGWRGVVDMVLSTQPRRRIRLTLWLVSALAYSSSAVVLWFGMRQGWMYADRLVPWCIFLALGLGAIYTALRTGWSERFADPGITVSQIVMGVIGVQWGYLICGPVRSVALFPLLLIFTFGAFSLSWRKIAVLTGVALVSLLGTIVALHASRDGIASWSLANIDLRIDLTNFLMISIMLPALSFVASMLSVLRSKLRSQREALTSALAEVQRLATHDELTGLCNRRYMDQRLLEEQAISARQDRPFSIALIDLDNFKRINDVQGHAEGDRVLQWFAERSRLALRTSDQIARWGGEEFLVLMPVTVGAQAQACIERLRQKLQTEQHSAQSPVCFSAGVTQHKAGETIAETLLRADKGMYAAKHAGRNRVTLC